MTAEEMASPSHLDGRVALVTGGARRVGRELVLALAADGARVVIHYHTSRTEVDRTAEEARRRGGQIALVSGDLQEATVAQALVSEAARHWGPPDLLINNASIFEPGDVADTSAQTWDRHLQINLRAPFLLAQAFARVLPRERRGDIINLGDCRVAHPPTDHLAYTVSKIGLHGLTQILARALAPRIRVNELALGAVLAPEGASASYVAALQERIPAGRFSRPEEVMRAMHCLLENEALTGQTILVDGGWHLV
jgi:NAD(P)-dependent dehydrogenase (short-subunit alcohol dehydrogenase family)